MDGSRCQIVPLLPALEDRARKRYIATMGATEFGDVGKCGLRAPPGYACAPRMASTHQAEGVRRTPRNMSGRLLANTSIWNPRYFGGFLSNSLIFWRPTPFANTQMGKGEMRNYRPNKGAPRNAAEPGGAPKFDYPRSGPIVFWRIFSKFRNIFAPGAPLPLYPSGKGRFETTDQTEERRGTPRNATEPD